MKELEELLKLLADEIIDLDNTISYYQTLELTASSNDLSKLNSCSINIKTALNEKTIKEHNYSVIREAIDILKEYNEDN